MLIPTQHLSIQEKNTPFLFSLSRLSLVIKEVGTVGRHIVTRPSLSQGGEIFYTSEPLCSIFRADEISNRPLNWRHALEAESDRASPVRQARLPAERGG